MVLLDSFTSEIWNSSCRSLVHPHRQKLALPPALRRLCIGSCGQLDRSFISSLEKVTSLTVLCLISCHNIESIPLDLIPCRNTLRFLLLACCHKLSSIGGSGIPSSIECVSVSGCPKLTQVQQPYKKNIGGMSDAGFLQGTGPAWLWRLHYKSKAFCGQINADAASLFLDWIVAFVKDCTHPIL